MVMTVRSFFVLLTAAALSGCSMFHHEASTTAQANPPPKKQGFSVWPFHRGPEDATPFLEYKRVRSQTDKSSFALFVHNAHASKSIDGDIRTTLETGPNESKVNNEHFTLAPQETKKLAVFSEQTRLTYEVSAFFKE